MDSIIYDTTISFLLLSNNSHYVCTIAQLLDICIMHMLAVNLPVRYRDAAGGLMFYRCYFLFNVAPFI